VIKHVSELKIALQEEGRTIRPPAELKQKVFVAISAKKPNKMKRHIAAVLIALFIVPTSAFAYQSLQADGLYGSFNNLKKHVASATLTGYMTFNAKLSQAKGELGDKEYEKFKKELNVLTDAKLKYGDVYGNINYDALPAKVSERLRQNAFELQPFFDRLNGDVWSKELLSDEEYSRFIDATITYESILAKENINASEGEVKVEDLPVNLQKSFLESREIIRHVGDLQQEYKENHQ
jgi:hypothetical protein